MMPWRGERRFLLSCELILTRTERPTLSRKKGWGTLVSIRFEYLSNWFPSRDGKTSSPTSRESSRPPAASIECHVPCIILVKFLPECAECWAESSLPSDKPFLMSKALMARKLPHLECRSVVVCDPELQGTWEGVFMHRGILRILSVGTVLFVALVLVAPRAKADIIEVESATSCPGSLGGGLCNGTQPFLLSQLLITLSQPGSIGAGTQKYVVFNDIGNSFSFTLQSNGQNNTGIADNASCQINGGASSVFSGCSIMGANGSTTSLGTTQINGLTFPATITFSGASGLDSTFILGFVSMQGASSITTGVPEPSTLGLLGSGILGLLSLAGLRRGRTA
jgi:PEP-CTERM motif